uniref:Putative ovule protein n=1 Tax=Solanum chacoense TaxID=4108 RepID=A0A0V0HQJ3_SOLCH
MELDLSSKFLLFLSFHTFHHIQCGMIFHHLFWLLLPRLLIQQLSIYVDCSGMVHNVSVRVRNKVHSSSVNLQCKKR